MKYLKLTAENIYQKYQQTFSEVTLKVVSSLVLDNTIRIKEERELDRYITNIENLRIYLKEVYNVSDEDMISLMQSIMNDDKRMLKGLQKIEPSKATEKDYRNLVIPYLFENVESYVLENYAWNISYISKFKKETKDKDFRKQMLNQILLKFSKEERHSLIIKDNNSQSKPYLKKLYWHVKQMLEL